MTLFALPEGVTVAEHVGNRHPKSPDFQIPGSEICELDREGFMQRTPSYVGDILYEHLQILKQQSSAAAAEEEDEEDEDNIIDVGGEAAPSSHPQQQYHHYQQQQQLQQPLYPYPYPYCDISLTHPNSFLQHPVSGL